MDCTKLGIKSASFVIFLVHNIDERNRESAVEQTDREARDKAYEDGVSDEGGITDEEDAQAGRDRGHGLDNMLVREVIQEFRGWLDDMALYDADDRHDLHPDSEEVSKYALLFFLYCGILVATCIMSSKSVVVLISAYASKHNSTSRHTSPPPT